MLWGYDDYEIYHIEIWASQAVTEDIIGICLQKFILKQFYIKLRFEWYVQWTLFTDCSLLDLPPGNINWKRCAGNWYYVRNEQKADT